MAGQEGKMLSPTKFKELIVDFDGTIVDSSSIFAACMNRMSGEFGYGKIEAKLLEKNGLVSSKVA